MKERLGASLENKQRIGPDRNKTKSARGPTVDIFGSDCSGASGTIKSLNIFNFFGPVPWIKPGDQSKCRIISHKLK
jgi:hypothetical protein